MRRLLCGFVVLVPLAGVRAQFVQRVNVTSNGAQAVEGGDLPISPGPVLSPDGRFAAFNSWSSLDPADANGTLDVYLRDRIAGATELVSVSSSGVPGNDRSGLFGISITPDGRFVAFDSRATNLVAGDTNGTWDVFLRDRQNGTTDLVSLASSGAQGDSYCTHLCLSPDARFVAFESDATNLVPGDTNGFHDIFVRDRVAGTTEIASVSTLGTQGDGDSGNPSISDDGRFVVFESRASTLVAGDLNGQIDVFLRDRQNGTTTLLSISATGVAGDFDSGLARISGDATRVVFQSTATTLVPGDTNGVSDIILRDLPSGAIQRISVSSTGAQADLESTAASLGRDWRYAVFSSSATNFAPGVTGCQVWRRDLLLHTTELVSTSSAGIPGNAASEHACVSDDGRFVAFRSSATNLVGGDTNGRDDVFLMDFHPSGFASLCDPGVGGVLACPCGNPPGSGGRGCENSSGTGGAALLASGVAYLSQDSLVFGTAGEKSHATSALLQGDGLLPTGAGFGQGIRCAGGQLRRLYVKTAIAGSIQAPDLGAGDPTVSARSAQLGMPIQPGQPRFYAVYYRDPVVLGGCPAGSTYNITQTGSVVYWP